jgi:hypothetical protein
MEAFGREWNVCAVASGVAINIGDASSIAFIATGDGTNAYTLTLTLSATFGGSYTAPSGWAPIVHYYTDSSNGAGTAIWSDKVANNAAGDVYHGSGSNVVPYTGTIADGVGVLVTVLASMVPSGFKYIKCTANHGGVIAITDLDVQRRSNNLPAMSA